MQSVSMARMRMPHQRGTTATVLFAVVFGALMHSGICI